MEKKRIENKINYERKKNYFDAIPSSDASNNTSSAEDFGRGKLFGAVYKI